MAGSNHMSLALQNRCGLTIKAQTWRLKIREHGTPKGRLGEGGDWACKVRMLAYLLASLAKCMAMTLGSKEHCLGERMLYRNDKSICDN